MTDTLKRVPLHDLHVSKGARMVGFAGYEMPVQYPAGVMKEHLHTRASAGLFDVSHMGQIVLRAKSGSVADAARALERLVPADILDLKLGRQRYTVFTNPQGGVLDDLMVANFGDHLFLVVNAACKDADERHLRDALSSDCEIEALGDRALLALQGPAAEAVLATLAPTLVAMKFMDAGMHTVMGIACRVSRSGYTGEDGFEISVPVASAEALATALLADARVLPIGLGARDSLRLEAGLCLYGHDMDTVTTPVEAAIEWSIQKSRRPGGVRAGGYPGSDVIGRQLQHGVERRRVGLRPDSRPVRGEAALFANDADAEPIGRVTSGGFGPSVNGPVAMGYVPTALAETGTRLAADVRGQRHPVTVAPLNFIQQTYKR